MMRLAAIALSLSWLSIAPATVLAKGTTVKIVINGPDLAKPIEITSPKVQEFQVWSGPGVTTSIGPGQVKEETEGFIIAWSQGIVNRLPAGLRHYEVSFYACVDMESHCGTKVPSLVYLVSYDFDPSSQEAFVYLPGPRDAAFRVNGVMYHGQGFEGHWMRATTEWDEFARFVISSARRR